MKHYPHRTRRRNIHQAILLIVLTAIIIAANVKCTPSHGCHATRGMSGYGLNQETGAKIRSLIDKYGGSWVKNLETGKVVVFNPEGRLIGFYTEKILRSE